MPDTVYEFETLKLCQEFGWSYRETYNMPYYDRETALGYLQARSRLQKEADDKARKRAKRR